MLISPSLLPQDSHSSFNCSLALSESGTNSSGFLVLGAEEKPPTQANVSRLDKPKFSDWPPPIERPAKARFSRSAFTEYFLSMVGITSLSNSPPERFERGRLLWEGRLGRQLFRRLAVRHDDDHRRGLLVRVEIVEDEIRRTASPPFVYDADVPKNSEEFMDSCQVGAIECYHKRWLT